MSTEDEIPFLKVAERILVGNPKQAAK